MTRTPRCRKQRSPRLARLADLRAKSVLQEIAAETDDERVQEAVGEALMQAEFLDDPLAFKLFLDRESADDAEDEDEE